GWNVGWDGNWTVAGDEFEFTIPHKDFDLEEVAAYAASKRVKLIGHHETGAAVANYESQLEDAFRLYQKLGVDAVKTGYVGWGQGIKQYGDNGQLIGLEWHHGQFMIQHYRHIVETAAKYQIMLDVHEPIKDTGIRRTYPNMMTREGARGQEYNAWGEEGGNPPEHTTILPFTRMLAGPFDFTPGIFDLLLEDARPNNQVNTTLAKQLALYVVIYSPVQMAADLPENYEGHPAFQFIRDVPVDWQDTQVLHAQIGDFVTIVRQDRNSEDWYLGSITDEEGRTLEASLTFLEPGRKYVAEIYADGAEADWESTPLSIDIRQALVDDQTVITLQLAPGGGTAIRFRPATPDEVDEIPPYQP
ncbi:MAG: glycoside hydrolase family 97 catalytic domain-containing protein, partial [Anaerolineales bacterium]